ncbi:MAG: hypothetical protein D6796_09570 [Caldilineae bacterium]|nr:MAG: hypothetical protein D6796_09570 [Caldilineae bacterium]
MKILTIALALLIALLGLRFLLAALKAFIMFFRVEAVPVRARQTLFRDLVMGILCLLLAVAMLT